MLGGDGGLEIQEISGEVRADEGFHIEMGGALIKLYDLFLWIESQSQGYGATTRRHFTFIHYFPRTS